MLVHRPWLRTKPILPAIILPGFLSFTCCHTPKTAGLPMIKCPNHGALEVVVCSFCNRTAACNASETALHSLT